MDEASWFPALTALTFRDLSEFEVLAKIGRKRKEFNIGSTHSRCTDIKNTCIKFRV